MSPAGPDYYDALVLEEAYLPKKILQFMTESKEDYNYLFRLHPASKEMPGEIEMIFDSLYSYGLVESIEKLEFLSEIPIYRQLKETDLHITLYSSATIEAAYVGVPTMLLDPLLDKGKEREKHFEKEIAEGSAFIGDLDNLEESFSKAFLMQCPAIEPRERFEACSNSLLQFLEKNIEFFTYPYKEIEELD